VKNTENEKTETIPQNYDEKMSKLLAETVDILCFSEKGFGKTNAIMGLTAKIAESDAKIVIFEYFPKWCNEWGIRKAKFIEIPDSWIIETDKKLNIENAWITHETGYTVLHGDIINQFLKENDTCIFLVNSDDMEKIAFFCYSVIYKFYRQRYDMLRKGFKIKQRTYFILEESQNCLNANVTNSKKLFNKYRKIWSEFRNMELYAILITQKYTDLGTFYRNRASLGIGKVNLAEWELRIKKLVSPIKDKDKILNMPKGCFYFTEINDTIQFPLFKPSKPEEYKPKITTKPEQPKPEPKLTFWNFMLHGIKPKQAQKQDQPKQTQTQTSSSEEEERPDPDESELDLTMTTGNDEDCMFPTDEI
jgi:hypothetical protein